MRGWWVAVVLAVAAGTAAVVVWAGDRTPPPADPLAALGAAVAALDGAEYSYTAELRVVTATGPAQVRIEGRVSAGERVAEVVTADGQRRAVRADGGSVVVETPDGPVALTAAAATPSPAVLLRLERPVVVAPSRVEGFLPATAVLDAVGGTVTGEVFVTIDLDPEGPVLLGYTLTDTEGRWRVAVRFAGLRMPTPSPTS